MIRLLGCLLVAVLVAAPHPAAAQGHATVMYVKPENAAHQPIYEQMKSNQVLERLAEFLKLFKLAKPLGFKLTGCRGEVDAWYEHDERLVTVCYEYIADVVAHAPKQTTEHGVTPADAITGPVVEVFLHEAAHALFAEFRTPLLGREEDAADQVAAFVILQLPDEVAAGIVRGVAYMYSSDAKREVIDKHALANEHSLPAQRFYNLACLAYGAKPGIFSGLVDKDLLPKNRAEQCEQEYEQVAYAVTELFRGHIDEAGLATLKSKLKTWKPRASWARAGQARAGRP